MLMWIAKLNRFIKFRPLREAYDRVIWFLLVLSRARRFDIRENKYNVDVFPVKGWPVYKWDLRRDPGFSRAVARVRDRKPKKGRRRH